MKNIILSIVLFSMLFLPAWAVKVEVQALSNFSSDNPPEVYKVKVVETVAGKKGSIKKGSIIEGKIKVTDAKRLKRDATFSFEPIKLITPDGKVVKPKVDCIGNYKKEVDKKQVAKSVAVNAGNLVVAGFSVGYHAVDGMVKNKEGNRLKSSAVSVYENSAVSYVEKGNVLEIKKGQHFFINFKFDDDK